MCDMPVNQDYQFACLLMFPLYRYWLFSLFFPSNPLIIGKTESKAFESGGKCCPSMCLHCLFYHLVKNCYKKNLSTEQLGIISKVYTHFNTFYTFLLASTVYRFSHHLSVSDKMCSTTVTYILPSSDYKFITGRVLFACIGICI